MFSDGARTLSPVIWAHSMGSMEFVALLTHPDIGSCLGCIVGSIAQLNWQGQLCHWPTALWLRFWFPLADARNACSQCEAYAHTCIFEAGPLWRTEAGKVFSKHKAINVWLSLYSVADHGVALLVAGAVLTHGNLIASAAGSSVALIKWTPGDRHISYLPLAHIYERVNLVRNSAANLPYKVPQSPSFLYPPTFFLPLEVK